MEKEKELDQTSPKLRFCEHKVKFDNQQIVELAYICKETIEICTGSHCKLFFEQANCFRSCFRKMRKMLKLVNPQYLKFHSDLEKFYREGRELSTDTDRLNWFIPDKAKNSSVIIPAKK